MKRKVIAALLTFGLLMSGCGKTEETTKKKNKTSTEKSDTEQSVTTNQDILIDKDITVPEPSETVVFDFQDENGVEYERTQDFYKEYCSEMVEEAKRQLPDYIKGIDEYEVRVSKVSNYDKNIEKNNYNINVTEISCDIDSVRCYMPFTLTRRRNSNVVAQDTGLGMLLSVNVHVKGTKVETGEPVDETYVSAFLVTQLGMTMSTDGMEIVDKGEIECDFSYLNVCNVSFHYYAYVSEIDTLLDADRLEWIYLCAHIKSSNKEKKEYYENFWSAYDKAYRIEAISSKNTDIYFDGHTGIEDPMHFEVDEGDGDGDDEPGDEVTYTFSD